MNIKNFHVLAAFALVLLASGPAFAQATRTWVSGVGDDANPCSRTAPCKTFAGAISKTATGGEIDVLDPGGFGGLTITKAITIDGNGQIAGVLGSGTNGFVVNAPGANVVLRNLSFEGLSNALSGIRVIAAKSVTIDNVTIRGFSNGVSVDAAANSTTMVRIVDSVIESNPGPGVSLLPTQANGFVRASLSRVRLINNATGLRADARASFSITDSTIAGNAGIGLHATSAAAPGANGFVDDCQISGNATGVRAEGAQASITLARSTVSNNGLGLDSLTSGVLKSFGNNQVVNNGADDPFTSTLTAR